MNKKDRSKIALNPKSPFKWFSMDIIPSTATKMLTSATHFSNYLLIVDAYSNIPKLCGMEKITPEEVMDKLDIFQYRFRKTEKFGWLYLGLISADAVTQFTSTQFKQERKSREVNLVLAAPDHQEMNGQVEVTWKTFSTIAHSLMVHARVS